MGRALATTTGGRQGSGYYIATFSGDRRASNSSEFICNIAGLSSSYYVEHTYYNVR